MKLPENIRRTEQDRIINILDKHLGHVNWDELVQLIRSGTLMDECFWCGAQYEASSVEVCPSCSKVVNKKA